MAIGMLVCGCRLAACLPAVVATYRAATCQRATMDIAVVKPILHIGTLRFCELEASRPPTHLTKVVAFFPCRGPLRPVRCRLHRLHRGGVLLWCSSVCGIRGGVGWQLQRQRPRSPICCRHTAPSLHTSGLHLTHTARPCGGRPEGVGQVMWQRAIRITALSDRRVKLFQRRGVERVVERVAGGAHDGAVEWRSRVDKVAGDARVSRVRARVREVAPRRDVQAHIANGLVHMSKDVDVLAVQRDAFLGGDGPAEVLTHEDLARLRVCPLVLWLDGAAVDVQRVTDGPVEDCAIINRLRIARGGDAKQDWRVQSTVCV